MARLLQTEIDVEPGRAPKRPSTPNAVGTNCAILEVENRTDRENRYTIRLRCDRPFWTDKWYTVMSIPPSGDAERPPAGKADVPGPNHRSVTLFVAPKGIRKVEIAFKVPRQPTSRAGVYPFTVSVEASISDPNAPVRKAMRTEELRARAIVRPFYDYDVELSPSDGRRIGLFRHSVEMEAVLANHGNDWLYCDLKVGQPRKDLLVAPLTQRVALPPPDSNDVGQAPRREIPMRIHSRLRSLRGAPVPLPVRIDAVRVDAPSVPPLPDDVALGGSGLGNAVLAAATKEMKPGPTDVGVVYRPPINAIFTGFFGALGKNVKGLIAFFLMLTILLGILYVWYTTAYMSIEAIPATTEYPGGAPPLKFKGHGLTGAEAIFTAGTVTIVAPMKALTRPDDTDKRAFSKLITTNHEIKTWNDYGYVTIPESEKQEKGHGQSFTVTIRRARRLWLVARLLDYHYPGTVTIGDPPAQPQVTIRASGKVSPGAPCWIYGSQLGTHGALVIEGKDRQDLVVHWQPASIEFRAPQPPANWTDPTKIYDVSIFPPGSAGVPAGQIEVSNPLASGGAGANGGGGVSGGGGASSSIAGGGGGSEAGGRTPGSSSSHDVYQPFARGTELPKLPSRAPMAGGVIESFVAPPEQTVHAVRRSPLALLIAGNEAGAVDAAGVDPVGLAVKAFVALDHAWAAPGQAADLGNPNYAKAVHLLDQMGDVPPHGSHDREAALALAARGLQQAYSTAAGKPGDWQGAFTRAHQADPESVLAVYAQSLAFNRVYSAREFAPEFAPLSGNRATRWWTHHLKARLQ